MQSAEIARRYLAYFEAQGHAILPSASLVADDPTLLFVVAGMQPFKPYLLGQQTPPFKRVADVQKCVRTLDIEEVGKTTRHATFFQMLGNWSFGDYFKEGAIRFAWELLTRSERDGGFGFPEEKLWATVLHGDDEAYAIWRDEIGVSESRIQRRGLADNYWHMGVPGPGGPCSEIYYDSGPEARHRRRPRGGRGPLPGDLEPGLHAGHAERGPVEGRFRHRRPAADEERRHRHGPGADGIDPAGGRQPLRDRHHVEDPRQGGRAHRAGVRHRPPQRRRAAGRRGPRAQRGDADRGRGAARQRGRQLRAPPAAAPQHPQPAPAVRRAARRRRVVGHRVHARADRDHDRRDGRAVPRAAPRRGQHPHGHRRGGRGVRGHAPHRHRDLRRGGRGDQAQARQRALRRAGVPAPRHLRLPDRPDPGDGGRAGAFRGRGRLPAADGRAAATGPRRTRGRRRPATPTSRSTRRSWSRRARSPSPATTWPRGRRPWSACSRAASR